MNVLSLCNGCGMIRPALERAGIKVACFYSSEIDKYANIVNNANYPDTIQLGDLRDWREWNLPKIDLLVAGFPCQDLSISGSRQGLKGVRSSLLLEALAIREYYLPKYWLFENVAKMGGDFCNEVSALIGANSIELNSRFWGAQDRRRLFWTNIPGAKNVEYLQAQNDQGIYLKDILIDGFVDCPKSRILAKNYHRTAPTANQVNRYFDGKPGQLVFDYPTLEETQQVLGNCNPSGHGQNGRVFSVFAKSPALTTNKGEFPKIAIDFEDYQKLFVNSAEKLHFLQPDELTDKPVRIAQFGKGNQGQRIWGRNAKSQTLASTPGNLAGQTGLVFAILQMPRGNNKGKLFDDGKVPTLTSSYWEHNHYLVYPVGVRRLAPVECERLMNLRDGYTDCVSNTQRYKMIGNGFDTKLLGAILEGIRTQPEPIQGELFELEAIS